MKQPILLLVSLALASCNSSSDEKTITTDLVNSPLTANSNAEKVLTPNIEMLETSYNFGEIQQGESVAHDFILKNTGDADLIISAAKGSCGCTVPQWPKTSNCKMGKRLQLKLLSIVQADQENKIKPLLW